MQRVSVRSDAVADSFQILGGIKLDQARPDACSFIHNANDSVSLDANQLGYVLI